jgi:hypothetical protein
MGNDRFELQNVAIPLKWQLPAQKCCKLQGRTADLKEWKEKKKTILDPF